MQPMQIAAYVSSLVLVACAARLPRVPAYVFARLLLDVIRLALTIWTRPTVALFMLDGALLMAGPAMLASALRLPSVPFAVFGLGTATIGARLVAGEQWYGLDALYGAALFTVHVAIVASAAASRDWRRRVDLSSVVLIVLAGSGVAGAIVALTWPDRWDAVNAGNVVSRALLCVLCLFADDVEKAKK